MAIKDKNGNIVKLRGPNPLMLEQEIWDKKKIKYINMKWGSIIEKDHTKKENSIPAIKFDIEKSVEPVEPTPEPVNLDINITKLEESIPETIDIVPKVEVPLNVNKNIAALINERKIKIHCLPAKQIRDPIYGTTSLVYQNKFIFEGIITLEEDMKLEFWSNIKIEIGSIIYPISLTKRWWKVIQFAELSGGFKMATRISETNPDFTD